MCIKRCTTSQQWHSGRKNQEQEASVKKVPGNKFENLWKESLSKTSSPAESNRTGKNIFYSNYLLFLNVLHLLPFLQQKLIITFSSIGFQTMSLKRTIRYNIFLISFITSVSFLNLNLGFNSIDKSPMDTGLRLSVHETFWRHHGRLLNASCTLNLHPLTTTTGNCYRFYKKKFSTEVLEFNNFGHNLNFYGEMVAIKYKTIEQNYSKYIFNENIGQNLQPIRDNGNKIKYHWITLLCLYYFIQTTVQPEVESPFCYYFFDTVYHRISYTQCCLS